MALYDPLMSGTVHQSCQHAKKKKKLQPNSQQYNITYYIPYN